MRQTLSKLAERILMWIAWKVPKPLARWVFVRVAIFGTVGKYSSTVLPEPTIVDALKRWK